MGGVEAALSATPLVAVSLLALTSKAKHLVLHTEAGEGLTGLYIFDLVHVLSMTHPTDKIKGVSHILRHFPKNLSL